MSWDASTAEWYAERYGEYATNRLAIDRIELAPDAVIADIGCGTGAALRHASERIPDGALIGVDPVPRMIEIAQERAAAAGVDIDFRLGPAESLPLGDASCDVVLAFDSMDHWSDVGGGLAEVRRVLRPGGQLVVVKDGGIPEGGARGRALPDRLTEAGFRCTRTESVDADGVAFFLCVAELG